MRTLIPYLLAAALVAGSGVANAQTTKTYFYTGSDFTVESGTRFSATDSVTGSFTIDCGLAGGAGDCRSLPVDGYIAAVTSCSFTASGTPDLKITCADYVRGVAPVFGFVFQTDANGQILSYSIDFESSLEGGDGARISLNNGGGSTVARTGAAGGEGSVNFSAPGVWHDSSLKTYRHTGDNFTVVSGARFSATDSLTATFTIECGATGGTGDCRSLPFANHAAAVTSCSFTASGTPDLTITCGDDLPGSIFRFGTDADGQFINPYNMLLRSSLEGGGGATINPDGDGFGFVVANPGAAGGEGNVTFGPGVWSSPVTYVEPPDLTSNLAIPDDVGSLGPGLNTVEGDIDMVCTEPDSCFGPDEADSIEFTVPAGLVVTGIELVISNYASTQGARGGVSTSSGEIFGNNITDNATFANIVATPGGLTAGTYDLQINGTPATDPMTLQAIGSISFDWVLNFTVADVLHAEPPDLTGNLAIPDDLGTVVQGTHVVSGDIDLLCTSPNNCRSGPDSADSIEFTVPAGLVVTGIELVISNYASTQGARGRLRTFSGGISGNFITDNSTFANIVATPGGLTAGTYDLQIQGVPGMDPMTSEEVGSVSLDWQLLLTVEPEVARVIIGRFSGTWTQAPISGLVEMTLTSQTEVTEGFFDIEGYFDIRCLGEAVCAGRELFSGTLDGNDLSVQGFELVDPINLVLRSYTAQMSADGNLFDGAFSGGTWMVDRNAITADSDIDGINDLLDNCLAKQNANQLNADGDIAGDACDVFPNDSADWEDADGDGTGNNTDPDDDNDGVEDAEDAFPFDPTESADTDGDGVGDNRDVFPNDATETIDTDSDGIGNNTDTDDDNDGILDGLDAFPLGQFLDVPPATHWAFQFIETLGGSGITSGCGNDNYCPNDSVTRAQMAAFLERGMNGSDFVPPSASGNVFLDVDANDFAGAFIEQLFLDGITSGCGNNNYCPNDSVTRAQMAVFLLRARYGAGHTPPPPTGVFDDVSLAHWAVSWIEQLAAEGITVGCGGGNYCPNDPVTRAQMAVFLVRTFGL